MDIREIRRARVRAWVTANGTPTKEKSYFSQLLSGLSSFGEKSARRLERDYKMGDHYLDTPDDGVEQVSQPPKERSTGRARRIEVVPEDHTPPGAVRIQRVKLKLSAGITGFGTEPIEGDDSPIYLPDTWLASRGLRREDLLALPIKGQSMEPTMFEGDTVVINTKDAEPKDSAIYAVNYEGEAVIKRLVRDYGMWWLVSDNPDQRSYPKKQCADDMVILVGRVVHRQTDRI